MKSVHFTVEDGVSMLKHGFLTDILTFIVILLIFGWKLALSFVTWVVTPRKPQQI